MFPQEGPKKKKVETKQPGFSHETPASCAQHPSLASLGLNQPPFFWVESDFLKDLNLDVNSFLIHWHISCAIKGCENSSV